MSRTPHDRSQFSKDLLGKDFPQSGKEKNTEGDLRDKIVDVTARVKEKAAEMAGKVSHTVGQTRDQAAERLDRAGSSLHEKAQDIPGGPKVVSVAHTIADGMESAAQYLRDANFDDMKENALATCRKYPAQTLIGALVVGFLFGRAVRR